MSTMNVHSLPFKNKRDRCLENVYMKKHGFNEDLQPNLTSTKAHLHNRNIQRSIRKKVKKKSSRHKAVDNNNSMAKESDKTPVSWNKNKKIHDKQDLTPERSTKHQTKSNSNHPNSSSSVIASSVRKLISSYSNKNISTLSWKNSKVSPRPKTSSEKKAIVDQTWEIKIKRQSCPPPLFQPSEMTSHRNVKLKKVYYSESQSNMLSGVPCVPPVSPLNSDFLSVEIVPCLADIKSQQLIKSKLRCLITQRQREDQRNREKILKEVKRKEREQLESLRQQRRAEIYALNEVMTENEKRKFLQFMKEKYNGTTKISLNV